jgi:CheY-like chemotaxis protein
MKNLPHFILLDDDKFALTLAKKIIQNYNSRAGIISFTTAKEALAYIATEDIAGRRVDTVLLTDLHMPEIDGFALLDQMEKTFTSLRTRLHIFVLSANATPDEIRKVLSYGCVTGFYSKPISIGYIKEIIDCLQYPL